MKSTELRALTLDELQDKLDASVKELFELRVRNTTKELDNTAKITMTRRTVARIKQAMAEKRASSAATK